jgi:hypothetical protein
MGRAPIVVPSHPCSGPRRHGSDYSPWSSAPEEWYVPASLNRRWPAPSRGSRATSAPLDPAARLTSALARRVTVELAAARRRLQAVSTDKGPEFRSLEFRPAVEAIGATRASSGPAGRRPTAASSAFSGPSSRGAADPASPAPCLPRRQHSSATWSGAPTTTTSSASTPPRTTAASLPRLWSTVPEEMSPNKSLLSPQLERRTC